MACATSTFVTGTGPGTVHWVWSQVDVWTTCVGHLGSFAGSAWNVWDMGLWQRWPPFHRLCLQGGNGSWHPETIQNVRRGHGQESCRRILVQHRCLVDQWNAKHVSFDIFWYLLIYCMCDGTNHSSMNMTHIQVPGTPWHPFLAAPCIVVQVEQSNGAPDDYYICHWFAAQELTENIQKLYSIHGTWSAHSAQSNLLVISLYGLNPLWDPGRRGSTELHTSSFESSFWTGSVSL